MSVAHGLVKVGTGRTIQRIVPPFPVITSLHYCKSGGLIESPDKVVERVHRLDVSVAFQSVCEAASVDEDVYVEFVFLLYFQVRCDPCGNRLHFPLQSWKGGRWPHCHRL